MLHYGQQVQHSTLNPLWNQLKASCDFTNARKEVEQFNSQNRWRKRGIAMVPTKFGISFTLKLMNQVGKEFVAENDRAKPAFILMLLQRQYFMLIA